MSNGVSLQVAADVAQLATIRAFVEQHSRALGIDAVLYDGSFEDWSLIDGPVEAPRP